MMFNGREDGQLVHGVRPRATHADNNTADSGQSAAFHRQASECSERESKRSESGVECRDTC